MRRIGIAIAVSMLLSAVASATEPSGPPQPSAEQKKLGYFVGTWKSDGVVKENPFMPAGKMTSTDRCEWFAGGFSVVCHSEGSSPFGPTKGIGIMGYSNEEKVYTYYGLDNTGMSMTTVPRGTVTGSDWVYNDESMMGGKMIKSRYLMKQVSPTEYTFAWQMGDGKGGFTTVMEGTSRKVP